MQFRKNKHKLQKAEEGIPHGKHINYKFSVLPKGIYLVDHAQSYCSK